MDTMTLEDRARWRARNEAIAQEGERWIAAKAAEFAGLATGTVVIVDIETGAYVTGATHVDAMHTYDRTIGPDKAGFVYEVGRRTFIGGGLGQG